MSFSIFSSHIVGIDLGSHSLRILKDDRIIFNERAVIAKDQATNRFVLLGNDVYKHDHESLVRYNPIDYVIADFGSAEHMVKEAIKKIIPNRFFLPLPMTFYAAIPMRTTEVEKRAYRDSLEHMNAKKISLIHSSVAIAIGLHILFEKKNFIIVDFSASKVEIALFHNAEPITTNYVRFGTLKMQSALRNYVKRTYKVDTSDDQLARILQNYKLGANEKTIKIQNVTIPMQELQAVLEHYFSIIDDMLLECLESIDPSTRSDVLLNGVFFSGGGAYYQQLCKRMGQAMQTGYSISSNPELDVINGVKLIMRDPKKYSTQLMR